MKLRVIVVALVLTLPLVAALPVGRSQLLVAEGPKQAPVGANVPFQACWGSNAVYLRAPLAGTRVRFELDGEPIGEGLTGLDGCARTVVNSSVAGPHTFRAEAVELSSESRPFSFTLIELPGPATNAAVNLAERSGSSVVSWDPPAAKPYAPVDSYRVSRRLPGASGWEATIVYSPHWRSWYNVGVANTTYEFRITAVNVAGESHVLVLGRSADYPTPTTFDVGVTNIKVCAEPPGGYCYNVLPGATVDADSAPAIGVTLSVRGKLLGPNGALTYEVVRTSGKVAGGRGTVPVDASVQPTGNFTLVLPKIFHEIPWGCSTLTFEVVSTYPVADAKHTASTSPWIIVCRDGVP